MSNVIQKPASACPSVRELRDFTSGALDPLKMPEIVVHLDACVRCDSLLTDLEKECQRHLTTLRIGEFQTELWDEREFQRLRSLAKELYKREVVASHGPDPERIGPYLVIRKLGDGGFATVYLGRDTAENRLVAIKVPRLNKLTADEAFHHLRHEAKMAAELVHPRIAQVFDCARDDSVGYYIAMQYIEGKSLKEVLDSERMDCRRAVSLTVELCDALQHAHHKRIYHRDVKPKNIMIDAAGRPYLIDFGLANHEQDRWFCENQRAGTENYMSPEQVRGESHRLDGRTDIWSLGAVLFEMLTGKLLFDGTQAQIFDEILYRELSPRNIDATIPRELERICMKCLSKRISDRFTTALDLATDLRSWLEGTDSSATHKLAPGAASVMPKGLRSFDDRDAEFFLDLLPGPRDRFGLPEQVRFWKSLLETADPDLAFPVGLIYGPSGGGKSSLVRAGLLPRLSESVESVYVLAASENTETRLLEALRRRFPNIPEEIGLVELLTELRSGTYLTEGRKVLIVFDHFEQWLHACSDYDRALLVCALRQCNGVDLQALVIVRDEFWMAVTRFFRALEIPLSEGRNAAAVDRFDIAHAKRVLLLFGRAHGALPDAATPLSSDQERFLDQAVNSVAEGGAVVCVHLALLVEMVKHLPWVPATLKNAGGAEGIGFEFLESKFGRNANPAHQFHAPAARKVLTMLLPMAGVDIRGSAKTSAELLAASGYSDAIPLFTELIQILEKDLRLITSADASGECVREVAPASDPPPSHYQLTHDFLVPALRKWIFKFQTETRRGRAELILEQRTRMWQTHRENKQLPTLREWAIIRTLTRPANWSDAQRKLMRKAAWVHGEMLVVVLVGLLVIFVIARNQEKWRSQTRLLVGELYRASVPGVRKAIQDLAPFRNYAEPMLSQRIDDLAASRHERLRAALALAEFGKVKVEFLVRNIDEADPDECANIVSALSHDRQAALMSVLQSAASAASRRQWRYKARLAIVAFHLGDQTLAKDMLSFRPDPIERTVLIDALSSWHGPVRQLLESARATTDGAYRSGMCLGVGSIPVTKIPGDILEELVSIVSDFLRNEPDGVTHSASKWALDRWNMPTAIEPSAETSGQRQWSVNTLDMTMIEIPAGTFHRVVIEEKKSGEKQRHEETVSVARAFRISDREVSCRQFQRFVDDSFYDPSKKPKDWRGASIEVSPTADHPVQHVSWIEAIQFCNWLSEREDLPPVYTLDENTVVLAASNGGYRLPFEAEWEYACRAGTGTEFACGDDQSLLKHYATFDANRTTTCGSKLPNGFGLFDVHGNVYEWCQDPWKGQFDPIEPFDESQQAPRKSDRVLRSGSFAYLSMHGRVYHRQKNHTDYRSPTIGFRVARSIP